MARSGLTDSEWKSFKWNNCFLGEKKRLTNKKEVPTSFDGDMEELPDSLSPPHSILCEPIRPLKNTEAHRGRCAFGEIRMKYLRLELKVCEGCGALWLRTGVWDGVYCSLCALQLSDFPLPKGKHAGGRPPLARASSCRSTHRQTAGEK